MPPNFTPPRGAPIATFLTMAGMYVADMNVDEEGSGSAFSNFTEGDNLTLTCAAQTIQGIELPYSSALTITLRVVQSTLSSSLAVYSSTLW